PQVVEDEDSEPPTVVVHYNGKKDAQHANEDSANQTTAVSVEEQTLEVEKTEDETSQTSADQTTAMSVEELTIEVAQTKVVVSHHEEDVGEASQITYHFFAACFNGVRSECHLKEEAYTN
ncbi:hypothetical protein GIB67_027575, partial [Kingdonia uniflora]